MIGATVSVHRPNPVAPPEDPHRVTAVCEYHEPHSTLNSLWAAMDQHDWFPDTVVLLAAKEGDEPTGTKVTDTVENLVRRWHEAYGGGGDVRTVAVDPISPPAVEYNLRNYVMAGGRGPWRGYREDGVRSRVDEEDEGLIAEVEGAVGAVEAVGRAVEA